jgi:hypothetical protein
MAETPEVLLEIVALAADQHRDNIDQAVDCAEKAWLSTEESPDFTAQLVRQAIRELIHNYRHQHNVAIRREAGVYGGPAKVVPSELTAGIAERSILDQYTIAGRVLGGIFGKELPALATSEREKAEGAAFNARLCERLATVVGDDQLVRDAISEREAWKLLRELRGGKAVRKGRKQEKAVA